MPKLTIPALPPRHKVRMQLIPETSWYFNLRKVLPKADWDKLRRQVYAYHSYQCAGCGRGNVQLHAHEVWKFHNKSKTQKLIRLVCLCELCHGVEHFGHTEMQGGRYYSRVVRHAIHTLGWSHEQLRRRREAAFNKWRQRNAYDWKVDFGPYKNLVPKEAKHEKP